MFLNSFQLQGKIQKLIAAEYPGGISQSSFSSFLSPDFSKVLLADADLLSSAPEGLFISNTFEGGRGNFIETGNLFESGGLIQTPFTRA